jgi:ABC-type multidrug transport system ATPase subunit
MLRIEGLSFGYPGLARLFDGFAFAPTRSPVILRGRSGCGKTTLLKILCGLLAPAAVQEFQVPRVSRMILQEDALFPWLTVEENIAVTARRSGKRDVQCPPVSLVNHLLSRWAFELSFGQRRLVELCRALIDPPPLLCLDEPFNFLDAEARDRLAGLIRDAARGGREVVISTHHQEDVELFDGQVFHFPDTSPIRKLTEDG